MVQVHAVADHGQQTKDRAHHRNDMSDEIPIRVMENDTPETNEKEWPIWPPNTRGEMFVVPSDFARKLERERDDLRDRLNELLNRPALV